MSDLFLFSGGLSMSESSGRAAPCVRLLPDGVGSRPPCTRWLSAGRVRCPLSSSFGGRAPHVPAMPCVRLLPDGGGSRPPCPRWLSAGRVRRSSSSGRRGGITPACPASVQALRYYRAGGRANGRHPRRASLFLKF